MAIVNSFAVFYGANYPLESNVLDTAPTYGDAMNVLNGTYVAGGGDAIPAADNVRDGIATGQTVGTIELPDADDVLLGVGYGAQGTERTGTLVVNNSAGSSELQKDIAFNAGDDYLGVNAITWESNTFAPMDGTLYFTLVDDQFVEWLNASPTYSSQTTVNLELTHEQTAEIPSDVYRYGIRHVDPSGVVRTLARGFCSVAMSYANIDPN
jgi:hypothetical protein